MRVSIGQEVLNLKTPTRLIDIPQVMAQTPVMALVNNRLRELHYVIDEDATIECLNLTHPETIFAYEASLRYLVAMAFKQALPEVAYKFNYSISRSTFCHLLTIPKGLTLAKVMRIIEQKMREIVALDLPIERLEWSTEKTKAFYEQEGYTDKLESLTYRPEESVHLYQAGDYKNYMYHLMVASTGVLKDFNLVMYPPGFLIQYPRAEANGKIPPFEDAPIFSRVLKDANRWSERIEAQTIAQINTYVEEKKTAEFVQMNESKHNQLIAELGHTIEKNRDDIRLIAIAGPSSSGKTTFSTRLRIELLTQGLKPVMISLDDYYLDREQILPNEDGIVDLEHIETLDIPLLNQNLRDLINGEEVSLPLFDFHMKRRKGYRKIQVAHNQPIIIEGIHALNDRLTSLIPKSQKYKIFIAPMLQINLDFHNPISLTNLRLLRRIVRDQKYRNSPAEKTIAMWDSVRKGEFKWIYPHQEDADFIFNSGLLYEFGVLKHHAMASLETIDRKSPFFITANRLIKFLKYFKPIDPKHVPCNSLLREFIGESCFEFE